MNPVEPVVDGVRIHVRIQPRASRSACQGVHDGRVGIRIAAPPVDGEANTALVAFLAKQLRVPRSAVTIVTGARSRLKTVSVLGIDVRAARLGLGIES